MFIDVENTSSEIDLIRVLEDLHIDRATTDLTAVGNWRVVGQQLGRMLAQRGAHLVHSAPAPRVPDWSDLWIAVTAGMWLGRAMPGDALDILSDDRAFDAVGDAAARLGVAFRRITYRAGAAERAAASAEEAPAGGRRRRRRRRGDGPAPTAHAPRAHAPRAHEPARGRAHEPARGRAHETARPSPPPVLSPSAEEERHAASLDQIRAVIARLTAADPVRGVSLDTLTLALKSEGFQRPPGSPRLVTRLRRIKDVELLPNGRVRLIGATAEMVTAAYEGSYDDAPGADVPADVASDVSLPDDAETVVADASDAAGTAQAAGKRRSRRRGGRGRRGGRRHGASTASPENGS